MTPQLTHCVQAALEKKAHDLTVLDLRQLSDVTDYFLICHGTSDRQVLAICEAIEERLKKSLGVRPGHVEGRRTAEWVLMDYIDLVVHIFVEEKRDFYGLERLWGDAQSLPLDGVDSSTDSTAQRPTAPG